MIFFNHKIFTKFITVFALTVFDLKNKTEFCKFWWNLELKKITQIYLTIIFLLLANFHFRFSFFGNSTENCFQEIKNFNNISPKFSCLFQAELKQIDKLSCVGCEFVFMVFNIQLFISINPSNRTRSLSSLFLGVNVWAEYISRIKFNGGIFKGNLNFAFPFPRRFFTLWCNPMKVITIYCWSQLNFATEIKVDDAAVFFCFTVTTNRRSNN